MLVFGFKGHSVVTNSMSPTFNRGDAVFSRKVDFNNLETGDIVTVSFSDGNGTFTHRIVEIDKEKGTFYTQGDNSKVKDGESKSSQIVGKVYFSIPLVGFISIALNNKIVLASILAAIIVISLAIWIISNNINKKKSSKGDKNEQ